MPEVKGIKTAAKWFVLGIVVTSSIVVLIRVEQADMMKWAAPALSRFGPSLQPLLPLVGALKLPRKAGQTRLVRIVGLFYPYEAIKSLGIDFPPFFIWLSLFCLPRRLETCCRGQ